MVIKRAFVLALYGCVVLCGSPLLGCSGGAPVQQNSPADNSGRRVQYSFLLPTGGHLSSEQFAGRASAILFITTFDLPSQASAKRLDEILRRHRPRANGLAVVLEAPRYAEFVTAFSESLELSYPVAMADSATLAGDGPFGEIRQVPVLVILDYRGREVTRFPGVASERQIVDALAEGAR